MNYKLSVCIPLYNEEEVFSTLFERLTSVLNTIPGPHEIIFVNDGSSDGTQQQLDALSRTEQPLDITCIHFSRNFGHQQAINAALEASSGETCIVMDGDLQDEPESIKLLLDTYNQGYDVVYARRVRRKEGLLLTYSYALFYRTLNFLSDYPLPLDAGDFAVLSRRVVDVILSCPERNRYLRGLRAWSGFTQTGIEIERSKR
jgi:polyisoprenyl-phosphate glycosyltransferase